MNMDPTTIIEQDEDENSEKKIRNAKTVFESLNFRWWCAEEPYTENDYEHWLSPLTETDKNNLTKDIEELSEKSQNDVKECGFINNYGQFDNTKYLNTFQDEVNKLRFKLKERQRRSLDDQKEPLQLPLVYPVSKPVPGLSLNFSDVRKWNLIDTNYHRLYIAKVWNAVFQKLEYGHVISLCDNIDNEIGVACGELPEDFGKNFDAGKITLQFDESVELELAMCGILKKRYVKHPAFIADNKRSKLPFSGDAYTDDIEDFVCGNFGDSLFELSQENNDINNYILEAMKKGWDMHNCSAQDQKYVFNNFINSKLGRYCSFVSNFAENLVDCLSIELLPNQYILKTLRHQKCLMLITRSQPKSDYIYVSFCFHKSWVEHSEPFPSSNHTFKELFYMGDYYLSRFVSFNDSKLFNLSRCEAIMFSVSCYFQAANGIEYWRKGVFCPDVNQSNVLECKSMIKFCLLVLLNDKCHTDELLILSRYIMMTGFIEKPLVPNPYKMFYKINPAPRSRLEVWIIEKYILASKKLVLNGGFKLISPTSTKKACSYSNLFNPFTLRKIREVDYLISLFYCGYLKNKNEVPEFTRKIKIFDTVIELENQKPSNYTYLSQGSFGINSISARRFNFSSRMLKMLIDNARFDLDKKYGSEWEETMVNLFLRKISTQTIEAFANLKSSSSFNRDYYYGNVKKPPNKTVLETIYHIVQGDDVYMLDLITRSLEKLESNGCLHAEIVQKRQHGAVREIYILGIYERIVQHTIETLATTICQFFESEVVTHPHNKFDTLENHDKLAQSIYGHTYQKMTASCDAEKWNHGQYVSKFAFLLCRMTSKSKFLHPFIIRTLSLWKHKRIMIDPQLVGRFNKVCPETANKTEFLKQMYEGYRGIHKASWMKQSRQNYIETETGMMQGILHVTSSLFHSILQEWLKKHLTNVLNMRLKTEYNRNDEVLIDVQQSSDDSSIVISFAADDEQKVKQNLCISAWAFKFKSNSGVLVGISNSSKTIENCYDFVEFNSEYFCGYELFRPTLREVISSILVLEADSLYMRQSMMSGCLTDVIEGGGSYKLASMCQIGQCLHFYRFLGSNFSPVFEKWMKDLLKLPDAALGFFLMDHPLCAGLLGMRYNVWNSVKSCPKISSIYASILNPISNGNLCTINNNTTDYIGLIPVDSNLLNTGHFSVNKSQTKINAVLNRLPISVETCLRRINASPRLIYCDPDDGEGTKIKMVAKLKSHIANEMVTIGSSVEKSLIPSIYSISKKVFIDKKVNSSYGCDYSLMMLLSKALSKSRCGEQIQLSSNLLSKVFPEHRDFSEISFLLENIVLSLPYVDVIRECRRKEMGIINITDKVEEPNSVSLMRILKRVWYEKTNDFLQESFERLFQNMQLKYPWITESELLSRNNSPFSDSFELSNFFRRFEKDGRSIMISGTPIIGCDKLNHLISTVFEDYSERHVLKVKDNVNEQLENEINKHLSLQHAMLIILNSFANEIAKRDLIIKLLQNERLYLSTGVNTLKKRSAIYILQNYFKNYTSSNRIKEFISDLDANQLGCIGGFEIEGHSSAAEYSNFTVLTFSGRFEKDHIRIHIGVIGNKNCILKVIVNNTRNFDTILKHLRSWANDYGIQNIELDSNPTGALSNEMHVSNILNFKLCSAKDRGAILCRTDKEILVSKFEVNDLEFCVSDDKINVIGNVTNILSDVNFNKLTSCKANENVDGKKKLKYCHCGKVKDVDNCQHCIRKSNTEDFSSKVQKDEICNERMCRKVILLTYIPDIHSDIIPNFAILPNFEFLARGWKKLIKNEEFLLPEIYAFIKAIISDHEYIDSERALAFIKSSLKSALIQEGIIKMPISEIGNITKNGVYVDLNARLESVQKYEYKNIYDNCSFNFNSKIFNFSSDFDCSKFVSFNSEVKLNSKVLNKFVKFAKQKKYTEVLAQFCEFVDTDNKDVEKLHELLKKMQNISKNDLAGCESFSDLFAI